MKSTEEVTVPAWRWVIWLLFLAAWTAALLVPIPDSGPLEGNEPTIITLKYAFSKSVHVSAYAVFAALTGWLRAPARRRWLLMFFLMAHGTLTELLQQFIATRNGCLPDVGFDNAGIAIGALIAWGWWTAADPAPAPVALESGLSEAPGAAVRQ